jgi:AcrR family transcriptional regulator
MAYDNTARARAARDTRAQVVTAARDLLLARGYGGTTIRAVATAAGVSPETVYKAFGGKAGLLKAVYDVTLAGDDELVPMRDRPQFQALHAARDPAGAAAAYAAIAGTIGARAGPLLSIVLSASGSDPDLAAFAETIGAERLAGARMVAGAWERQGWLRTGLTTERAADIVWTLISPPVHALLASRGWDTAAYQAWLAATLLATVLTGQD